VKTPTDCSCMPPALLGEAFECHVDAVTLTGGERNSEAKKHSADRPREFRCFRLTTVRASCICALFFYPVRIAFANAW